MKHALAGTAGILALIWAGAAMTAFHKASQEDRSGQGAPLLDIVQAGFGAAAPEEAPKGLAAKPVRPAGEDTGPAPASPDVGSKTGTKGDEMPPALVEYASAGIELTAAGPADVPEDGDFLETLLGAPTIESGIVPPTSESGPSPFGSGAPAPPATAVPAFGGGGAFALATGAGSRGGLAASSGSSGGGSLLGDTGLTPARDDDEAVLSPGLSDVRWQDNSSGAEVKDVDWQDAENDAPELSPVPIPGSGGLVVAGLAALGLLRKRS